MTEWNHNYLMTSLGSTGDHVFAGDQISSVSLLQVGDNRFQTVARDYGPRWPVSVEAIDEKNVIGANVCLPILAWTSCSDHEIGCVEPVHIYALTQSRTKRT